jgi:Dihydrofolate reductase
MGKLIYLMNVSLDGFVETPDHNLDWTNVDDELHTWFNDRERETAASIYGRRLYEVMAAYWPTAADDPNATPVTREFAAIWNSKPKIVFSRSIGRVDWNSRLVHGDVAAVLADLRAEFDGDLDVGGPTLAAQFIERGLVDVYRLVVHPVILGAGTPFFPPVARPIRLRLIDSHTFDSGVLYLGYAPA